MVLALITTPGVFTGHLLVQVVPTRLRAEVPNCHPILWQRSRVP